MPKARRKSKARVSVPRGADAIKRPAAEGALAWLRRRKDKDGRALITEMQFNAGEKLAADFWHAQLSPKVTASWSAMAPIHRLRRATPGLGVDMRDAVVAARERFQRALEAVGPELAGILVDVCCHDMGLEASGHAVGLAAARRQGGAGSGADAAGTALRSACPGAPCRRSAAPLG